MFASGHKTASTHQAAARAGFALCVVVMMRMVVVGRMSRMMEPRMFLGDRRAGKYHQQQYGS
jgi:hypothetical protein